MVVTQCSLRLKVDLRIQWKNGIWYRMYEEHTHNK